MLSRGKAASSAAMRIETSLIGLGGVVFRAQKPSCSQAVGSLIPHPIFTRLDKLNQRYSVCFIYWGPYRILKNNFATKSTKIKNHCFKRGSQRSSPLPKLCDKYLLSLESFSPSLISLLFLYSRSSLSEMHVTFTLLCTVSMLLMSVSQARL